MTTTPTDENTSLSSVPFGERELRDDLCKTLLAAVESGLESEDETPHLAEALILDAYQARATDVHLDPYDDGMRIRLRIDGTIYDTADLEKEVGGRLLNQFKTMAEIDPVAMFVPDESRFSHEVGEHELDLRLGIAPSLNGQKAAIRVLQPERLQRTIDELGMEESDLAQMHDWLGMLAGMLVVAGPTGSGKTTTLYALLHALKMQQVNVISIEDPVEYAVKGITQVQVDPEHDLTFAAGIRSMLRLDPDYMMVGETRDADSARAAIAAAVSGVPLMTTVHSRDTAGIVTVLRNFGLTDHQIAATTALAISQRLVRRLCANCRQQVEPSRADRQWFEAHELEVPEQVWTSGGCEECSNLGFRDRVGIFELWVPTEEDRQRILASEPETELRQTLHQREHRFLIDDAVEKASQGLTSIRELARVI